MLLPVLLCVACSSGAAGSGQDSTTDPSETEDSDDDDNASDDPGDGDGDGEGSSSDDDEGTPPDDDSDEGTPPDDADGDGDGDGDDGAGDGDDNMSMDPYDVSRCDDPSLEWKSGNKTVYESYPEPGSPECEDFNGCKWAGQLAACEGKQPEAWIEAHNIVSVFPDFGELEGHDLCLRSGDQIIIATAYDTCGDDDCMDCCSDNLGDADQLIDVEKYTEERWGVEDGPVEWADLGARDGVCD